MEFATELLNLLFSYGELVVNVILQYASPYKLEIVMGLLITTFFFGLVQGFK
ncbi:hypothetical protein ACG2F4_02835 [Halalkalibaculum sp. DA3122]|uniref:hypothetical protein n=1 Tax=unclassified Halalkalibaculum TaxID=2964617 RepID=UPI00375466F6